ncbi:nuclear transport factor 2 family protein [Chryseobacterium sp. SSA4.19]|uniref:nuclear transport factor 2 family protein n=1 Tax=Chryseobacterium sp. SSA4.19 TaxID=2919915 RepID=UPI001F4DA147|nr:nuclear transport factor 2 family protein [Chryseobacterium sp. SSA4.19]MCJ8155682.1 nuclear transport factor 2 family protein [Chryseobacterium sp. SSA4.19]
MLKIFSSITLIIMMVCIMYSQKINHQLNIQITMNNAALLHEANEFVKQGKYENFLAYCKEDTRWVFIGERVLSGKEELRAYMKEVYWEPPVFTVDRTIEEGDFVTVTGEIRLTSKIGKYNYYDYCDVWRFNNGKIAELKAYVIEKKISTEKSQNQD